MKVISERLATEYPEEDKGWGATVLTLQDQLVGDVRPALLILLGAVGFVLLIACANTANLVLARTLNRRKELAIRAALGASSSQVIRPVVVETVTLALLGGLLGLVLASYGQPLVVGALADQLPHAIDVGINLPVLLFTLIASVVTGLASGLIASWRLLRADVSESLKQGLGKTDAYAAGKRYSQCACYSRSGSFADAARWGWFDDPHALGAWGRRPRLPIRQPRNTGHAVARGSAVLR